jgi:CBS domain-containing protein
LIEPRVLGVGYDTIHGLLRGEIIGGALIGLLIGKAIVWSIALGSGTSGGVLAPLLIMGGALGAFEARFIPVGDASLWAIISMAAMMGGTMRSPLTAMVFTLELTHDLNLLPGLLVGSIAAHALTVLLLRRSILTEKVARRGYHITREYSVDPLTAMRVEEVMDTEVPTVAATMRVSELSDRIANHDPLLTRRQGIPIINEENKLVGIITRGDLLRSLEQGENGNTTVLDAGSRELIVAYPDEILQEAVTKMLRSDIGRLPVVDRDDPRRLVGYLGRACIMSARLKSHDEEFVREQGWLSMSA